MLSVWIVSTGEKSEGMTIQAVYQTRPDALNHTDAIIDTHGHVLVEGHRSHGDVTWTKECDLVTLRQYEAK